MKPGAPTPSPQHLSWSTVFFPRCASRLAPCFSFLTFLVKCLASFLDPLHAAGSFFFHFSSDRSSRKISSRNCFSFNRFWRPPFLLLDLPTEAVSIMGASCCTHFFFPPRYFISSCTVFLPRTCRVALAPLFFCCRIETGLPAPLTCVTGERRAFFFASLKNPF